LIKGKFGASLIEPPRLEKSKELEEGFMLVRERQHIVYGQFTAI
jgi:hypothetical protein